MGKLLDAGMNVMRMNFSHGSHEGHYEVLQKFRKVASYSAQYAECTGALPTLWLLLSPLWCY